MKTAILLLYVLSGMVCRAYSQDTVNAVYGPSYHKPEFAGDINSFITKNLHYPLQAREMQVEGRVLVSFMVDEQGNISDIRIKRGLGLGCDEEAIRIIKHTAPWKPATYKGRKIKAIEMLNIVFRLY